MTVEDRVVPTVTVTDARASEGSDALEFEISMDVESPREIAVHWATYSPLTGIEVGDAVHLSDYRGGGGTVRFRPGETRKRVRVDLIDDDLNEGEESFEFSLSNPQDARLPGDVSVLRVKGIIEDDDPVPTVTLELSDDSVPEGGGMTAVTARVDHWSGADTTVVVSATPEAPATAADFVLSAERTLTIPASQWRSTETVTITAVDDFLHGADKTITVQGVATNLVGVLGPGNRTLIIEDDDTPSVTVAPASLEVREGESARYTVRLASQPTGTVTVTVTGGAQTDVSVDKPTLTFTPENWSTAQTVTVTAALDVDTVDDHHVLVHSAIGGGYDNVDLAHVDVTVLDNRLAVVTVAADVEEVIYNLPRDVFDLSDASFTLTRTGRRRRRWRWR